MIRQDFGVCEETGLVARFEYPESEGRQRFEPTFLSEGDVVDRDEAEWNARFNDVFPSSSPKSSKSLGAPTSFDRQVGQRKGFKVAASPPTAQIDESGESLEEIEATIEQQCALAEIRGRKDGFSLGLASAHSEAEKQREAQRSQNSNQIAEIVEALTQEKADFLEDLEEEAASLALAIAARLLRRESSADPLLLLGAVKIAFSQIAESTRVRLRIPEQDEELWKTALSQISNLPFRPEILADPSMQSGELRVESDLGTADLGLNVQLALIEQSFFDV